MLGFTGYLTASVFHPGYRHGHPVYGHLCARTDRRIQGKEHYLVGTRGAIHKNISLGQVILAGESAWSDSATNRIHFGGQDFAPTVSFELVKAAYEASMKLG